MKTIILEIKEAEGGQDAKMLVQDMEQIYRKAAQINGFTITDSISRPGFSSL